MLTKLIRPFIERGFNGSMFICSQKFSTSTAVFQQSSSGKNTGGSPPKTTEKAPNLKNQQQNQQKQSGNKNKSRADNDVEQERSQHEGPVDRKAEQTSSNSSDTPNKSKKK